MTPQTATITATIRNAASDVHTALDTLIGLLAEGMNACELGEDYRFDVLSEAEHRATELRRQLVIIRHQLQGLSDK